MLVAGVLLCGGLVLLGALLGVRLWDAVSWRQSLTAYQLHPSARLSADDTAAWLTSIQAMTHPTIRLALLPLPPVCIEVVGTARGVSFYVLVIKGTEAKLLSSLRASMPGVRLAEAPDYVASRSKFQVAAEATMTSWDRPLSDRAEAVNAALLASLQPVVGDGTEIRWQVILTSAGTPLPVRTASASSDNSAAWSWEGTMPRDAEAVQAARAKQREPLLFGVARLGVAAENKAQAFALLSRIWNNLHTLNAPGVRIRRRWLPSALVAQRLCERAYPITRWPLLISTRECAGLMLPISGVALPGIAAGSARQLPPSPHMPTTGQVVAVSNYPGMTTRPLALTAEDRTRHSYIVGPAGSGKSVLLTRLILSDIQAGYGVFACDPKGDLLTGILERLDDETAERVIVLDASKRERPIGLNILGHAHTEEARELVVDNVLHIFREIWSAFWGPRTDQVLRAALSTLVNVRAPDGSAMTLCEIVPLLTNPAFRRYVSTREGLPSYLRDYWQRFNNLSENEMAQFVGPVLNKAEAFTQRVPIRLMLGQSEGVNFEDIFRRRAAVLVNLAKGNLGTETGNLLGALVISELWKATLGRVRVPIAQRRPCFAYIDEAQDIVRLPLPIADMLAQARGFKLGATLANQYLTQLSDSVRAAVLGTVRTQIAFAVEYDDAKILERRFAPLTADDLSGLRAFELAMRPCVRAQTLAPVTGVSLPLDEAINDSTAVAECSRQRWGHARAGVEAALQARSHIGPDDPTLGRRRRGGAS